MKYTDEEIINKFSKVDFDKTGAKKQAVYNRVVQACAQRRENMNRKLHPAVATAAVLLLAVPTFIWMSGAKREIVAPHAPVVQEQTVPQTQTAAAENVAQKQQETVKADGKTAPEVKTVQTPVAEYEAPAESLGSSSADGAARLAAAPDASAAKYDYAERERALRLHNARQMKEMSFAGSSARRAGMSAKGGAMLGGGRSFAAANVIYMSEPPAAKISQDTKGYEENTFKSAQTEPLSTFSADVDTASYTMLKEQINRGWRIDKDGVRTEALINNFAYNYPAPTGKDPVSITLEYAPAPWNENNQLVKVGVKAKELDRAELPQSNLVFLIDVSGSMRGENRLPLVKKAFKMLLNQLDGDDIVSIVTYASGVDVKLDGVKAKDKQKIVSAIDALRAGGATSGEEGLKRAYEVAKKHFLRKGNNRIIIASDGDFNVGSSDVKTLEKQVSSAKESGVFISALGFGMGNYRDNMMETIADKGNGNYGYINDLKAAQKALVREFGGTLFTVAKDVKFQVEFNPAVVGEYRLIGYEKRLLNNEDFNDDTKDAGEMGSGHTVTVFYEIRPKGGAEKMDIDPLKYTQAKPTHTDEVLTVKMRYKDPQGDKSKLLSKVLYQKDFQNFDDTSDDFRFAAAAAAFGQLVRGSEFVKEMSAQQIAAIAAKAKGTDDNGDRAEFVQLIRTYGDTPEETAEETKEVTPVRPVRPVPVEPTPVYPTPTHRCGPNTRCFGA